MGFGVALAFYFFEMKLPIVQLTGDQERQAYAEYWRRVVPHNSILPLPTTDAVAGLFRRSGLPDKILARV